MQLSRRHEVMRFSHNLKKHVTNTQQKQVMEASPRVKSHRCMPRAVPWICSRVVALIQFLYGHMCDATH